MRKIKFRAWDEKYKRMWNPLYIEFNYDGRVTFVKLKLEELDLTLDDFVDHKTGSWRGEDCKDFIPMQCTGLKDKNGKKIYEGDILKYQDEILGAIKFDKGVFDLDHPVHELSWFWHLSEVIGNIYENPELLKCDK